MKYFITIHQDKILELMPRAKVVDGIILDYVYWFCTSPSPVIEEKRIVGPDGLKYTWLNYDWLLNDLPILRINAKSALTPVFQRLEKCGFLKSYSPDNQRKFIALLPMVDELFIRANRAVHKYEQNRSRRRTNPITTDPSTKIHTPYRNEALEFNKNLFSIFKKITDENLKDYPEDRKKYPRLIRQKMKKENLTIEFVEEAIIWAWNLRSKKTKEYYWRGKLTTLRQVYYKIIPAYLFEVKATRNLNALEKMKRSAIKPMVSAFENSVVQDEASIL
jgi:hypothetical protein